MCIRDRAKLIHNKQVKKLIATHVGLNPEVATQSMQDGTLEVVLIPQGSLAEMIRADGAGLGGVLTPTGVGTIAVSYTHLDVYKRQSLPCFWPPCSTSTRTPWSLSSYCG